MTYFPEKRHVVYRDLALAISLQTSVWRPSLTARDYLYLTSAKSGREIFRLIFVITALSEAYIQDICSVLEEYINSKRTGLFV